MTKPVPTPFSGYQKVVVAMLAFLQFAVILDFMLMSPLGAVIMPALNIGPKQFGLVVSAYAFSAGASGLLTAGFADRFDRKKLLLFFYSGFILGTLWCGLAQSFESLLAARIVTGLFGGVIGSVVLAIATDLFAAQQRGRVMGLIQTAFAASQVLGIPVGIYLSNQWNWHIPFVAMAAFGLAGGLLVAWKLQPVNGHLGKPQEHSAWMHLFHTVTERRYLLAFATTTMLTTGGFMLMPFGSAYVVNNLGIDLQHLPTVYLVTGLCTIFVGPMVGKAADALGKFRVFLFGTALTISMVLIYTHLGTTSLAVLIIVNTLLFIGVFSRMIPFQAMMASVPAQTQRGSFNAISASIQQLSGGLASVVAGHIVTQSATGRLQNFDVVGFVVVGTSLVGLALLWRLNRNTLAATAQQAAA
ncbi:major facilitator superfamily MFS_1 protein [Janthinobacterium sp. HH01]|uniref:MFS transporter n=1 Tax=Janthinobacterium sp. HH01 TaxID=1198452 RepID=UPI0002AE9150|nr:MFS transporter [Janthinobacterium sp. HH01]ELX13768.1 major facilitator superfamily MFS_1 protein [Janthinobacterium sp. HH01]